MKAAWKEEYPKCLYHPDGRAIVVKTMDEHGIKGDGWYECPAEAKASVQGVAECEPVVMQEPPVVVSAATRVDKFYALPVAGLLPSIVTIESVEELDELIALERANPRRPRQSVIRAALDRRAELTTNITAEPVLQ